MKWFTFLRSRRVAAILLVALTAYAWLATLLAPPATVSGAVPQTQAPLIHLLKLDKPYSNPVFLVLVAWLTLSTTACAWERTRFAVRALRENPFSEKVSRRLLQSPSAVIAASPQVTPDALVDEAEKVLARHRMKVRRQGGVIVGSSGKIGLLGSPLFHWALVGLFVFAALGQLVKYEGVSKVVVGDSLVDSRKHYNESLHPGLLSGDFTGARIKVDRIGFTHIVSGINRGPAPVMTASDGRSRKSAWVYANHPMRFKSLVIHSLDTAPAFLGTVRLAGTNQSQRIVLYFDEGPYVARSFVMTDRESGAKTAYTVTSVEGRRVRVTSPRATPAVDKIAGIGQNIDLGRGLVLTVDDLTAYVQVKVIRDWTVPLVYAMFVLGCLASALTVLAAPRMVWICVQEGSLNVLVRNRPSDPAFRRRICEALETALAKSEATRVKEISA